MQKILSVFLLQENVSFPVLHCFCLCSKYAKMRMKKFQLAQEEIISI